MAYDEDFADRIRRNLQHHGVAFTEKNMMGGLTFMVDDKMCVGIYKNNLMVRTDPAISEQLAARPGASVMEMAGKTMNGFLSVSADAVANDKVLDEWIGYCLAYNPFAKSSKKKK